MYVYVHISRIYIWLNQYIYIYKYNVENFNCERIKNLYFKDETVQFSPHLELKVRYMYPLLFGVLFFRNRSGYV
jgi:hypothetical protein